MRRNIIIISVAILFVAAVVFINRNTVFFKKAKGTVPQETPPQYDIKLVKQFPFSEEDSLKEWEEKVFKGKVIYKIERDASLSYVRASSSSTASALYYKISINAKTGYPVVSWKWKVEKFPAKKEAENLERQETDDFAARVYVIFPAMFLTNSKVLEYVWAETLPVDSMGTSPYSKNIKLIVARSGPANGQWAKEERDIIADYIKAFGRTPEYNIGAIAFMTNTEHTGSSADSMYDEIKIGYKTDKGDKTKEGGSR